MDVIRRIETENMKKTLPVFGVGDTVRVGYKIREGEKERIQVFQGTVIGVRGSGIRKTVKVRRIVAGQGVERTFPLHSPKLVDIEVTRTAKVRRAKLYYLRGRIGKATRVRQAFGKKQRPELEAVAKDAVAEAEVAAAPAESSATT